LRPHTPASDPDGVRAANSASPSRIEPVRAIAPPVAQHGDGAEAFPQALLDQTVEVEREFGHWVHRG